MANTCLTSVAAVVAVGVIAAAAPVGRSEQGPSSWQVPAGEAGKRNPISPDDKSVARGKEIYSKNCLDCHGQAGKGDGRKSADLKPKPRDLSSPDVAGESDGALYWKITEGRRPMPTFRKLLSDEERWHVVNYIRTFHPKGQTPKGN
jgi:mono/diheme cytochrome c family protein